MRILVWETVAVALVGAGFGLAANQLSPRGLDLKRDYFHGALRPIRSGSAGSTSTSLTSTQAAGATAVPEALVQRIRAQGLQVIGGAEARQLFDDPRTAQEQVLFVDARNQEHYEAGHIPGAFLFDHYRAQDYLPTVLPACQAAQQIVIYCTGGECEDSEFAAIMLRDAGIPGDRLLVYAGGFNEWSGLRAPIETGARKSGQLTRSTP